MLKILHYIPGFLYGGIESMFLSWYRNIDHSQVEFELLLRTQDDEASALQQYRALGGRYFRLPKLGFHSLNDYRRGVARFFREHHDYDIVHAHSASPLVMYYAHKYGMKCIIHSHTTRGDKGLKSWLIENDEQIEMRLYADRAMACSKLAARWKFGGMRFRGKPVTIIHNAIDAAAFDYNPARREQVRRQEGWQGQYVVGHVGRLTPPKNQFYLLDIFAEVTKLRSDAILVIIGDGPDGEALREYAGAKGVADRVKFLGVRADMAALYQGMDCFLLPSRWEGLGIVAIEAQAAGLPCLISNVVPWEADLTANVFRMSIQDTPGHWAQKLVGLSKNWERSGSLKIIQDKGYDVKTEVGKLIEKYYEVLEC